MRYTYTVILLLLISFSGFAQTFLTGKVRKKESTETLLSVSIQNRTQQKYDLSDEGGSYRIPAREGDRVTFSSAGYITDTLTITASMLSGDYPVFLEARVVTLKSVRIGSLSNYQLDSIERREDYKWVYDHGNEKLVEKDRRGQDGVGVNIALFRNGSRADKERESLKKRLMKEEEEHYIDFRYSPDYVTRFTHLKGDSLQKFMQQYRPTYDFVRKVATVDILLFINDAFKKFKSGIAPDPKTSDGANTSTSE